MNILYSKYYDKIYYYKDYKSECKKVLSIIKKYKKTKGKDLLDVACGTGNHIRYFKKYYNIAGIDLSKEMLGIAKKKFPDINFYRGDMRTFDLKKKFDVVTCLFSAVAHMKDNITQKNRELFIGIKE